MSKATPPGLASRDLELPPGIAKKLEGGGTLPPGIAKRFPAAIEPVTTPTEVIPTDQAGTPPVTDGSSQETSSLDLLV
jgi:hypothetical protein